MVEIERPVELGYHRLRPLALCADHDAVGSLEIGDGGAFAQELRVRDDGELRARRRFADDAFDLVTGADRHGRFRHHHRIAVEFARDLARRLVDVGQIGEAVAAPGWRADRDEDGVGAADRLGEIGGE